MFKKLFTTTVGVASGCLLLCSLLCLYSCSKSVGDKLTGSWLESVEMGDSTIYQGFTLKADSVCASINMATLRYAKWGLEGQDQTIIMHGRSLGNGGTFDFIDTLSIVQLSQDSLIVSRNGQTVRYFRVDASQLSSRLGGRINPVDSLLLNPAMGGLIEKTYNGVIPAADCPGIDCTLKIWGQEDSQQEGVYSLAMKYLEAENGKDITNTTYGRYFTHLGLTEVYGEEILQLLEFNKAQPLNFYIYPGADSVLWLGGGYTRIDSKLNYNLRLTD